MACDCTKVPRQLDVPVSIVRCKLRSAPYASMENPESGVSLASLKSLGVTRRDQRTETEQLSSGAFAVVQKHPYQKGHFSREEGQSPTSPSAMPDDVHTAATRACAFALRIKTEQSRRGGDLPR